MTIDPLLAKAIVAAQSEAESLVRDGAGQHGKYTSSDEVAAVARGLLSKHGAAWVRTSVDLEAPRLGTTDLGNQAYVGDVIERWLLVHESGACLEGVSRMPVIASKGRPQDRAVGASLTYDAGHTLRGVLCLDREDKDAVDRRHDANGEVRGRGNPAPDYEPPPRRPPDIGPRCSGTPIADAVRERAGRLSEALTRPDKGPPDRAVLWGRVMSNTGVALAKYDLGDDLPSAGDLTLSDGQLVKAWLDGKLAELLGDSGDQGGDQ